MKIGEYNRSIYPDYLAIFRARGMKAGAWVTEGGNLYMIPSSSDLGIAEIEGPGDYEGVMNVVGGAGAGPLPTCPLATVTNFNTPLQTRAAAKPLIDAGFTCMPEAYLNENDNASPDTLDRVARDLGWPTSQPVAGVYPTPLHPTVPSYAQWDFEWPLADYLGEYVI